MKKTIVLLLFWLFVGSYAAKAELITYKQPTCEMNSRAYDVEVREKGGNWQHTGVYSADVAFRLDVQHIVKKTSFAYFDCSDSVLVRVKANDHHVDQVNIRPAAYGIKPKIDGSVIEFTMKSGQYISVEINGEIFENLQIFSEAIEQERPHPNDPGTIFFGPGIHNVGRMNIPSNKTVYIAGGAIVQGAFIMDHVKNVRILGRGILTQHMVQSDGAAMKENKALAKFRNDELLVQFSEGVTISGIIEVPQGYSAMISESKSVTINDFKAFSSLGNADGIDIFCSQSVTLNHLFMRNSDDCIAIYGHRWSYYGNVSDINIQNATLWADVAHPFLIGTHGDTTNPDTLQNIHVRKVFILDQHENQLDYQGCIALNAGDSNLIRNISFDDIDIGDIRRGQLFNLRVIFNHKYNTSAGHGIENIRFSNVSYNGSHANISIISGYDSLRAIKNILFENLKVNGLFIHDGMKQKPSFYKTADMANIFIGEHVEGVKFALKD